MNKPLIGLETSKPKYQVPKQWRVNPAKPSKYTILVKEDDNEYLLNK